MAAERSGCFRWGCFGCLGLGGLAILGILALGALQFFASRGDEETTTSDELERQLPAVDMEPPPLLTEAELESREFGREQILEMDRDIKVGRLELDLSIGEFEIEPGPAGEPVRVEAEHHPAFRLEEELVPDDDGRWVYRVRFGSRRGFLATMLRGGNQPQNRVRIIIPRGQPMDLVGTLGVGEFRIDLGGLWLREVDLSLGVGEHRFEFSEVSPQPLASFVLDKGMGDLEVRDLGNASPRHTELSGSMGSFRFDLAGPWRADATLEARMRMGELSIDVPRTLRVEVERSNVSMGERRINLRDPEDVPADAPVMRLSLSGSMGEIRVDQ